MNADLYVSPAGRDDNPGTFQEPFASLARAVKAVGDLKKSGQDRDLVVYLRGGEYFLKAPVMLTEADSGENGHRIIYRAYPGETPVLLGAVPITDWEETEPRGGHRTFRAPIADQWLFHTLYEDDTRVRKARTPNEGYLALESGATENRATWVRFREGDLPEFDFRRTQLLAWCGSIGTLQNNWRSDLYPILDIRWDERRIRLGGAPWWPFTPDNRYFVQGAIEFLDAPGEYHIDRKDDWLYYIPLQGDVEGHRILAPTTGTLVSLAGSSPKSPVHHISFEGLSFRFTDFSEEYLGGSAQAHEGALTLVNTQDIDILGCRIAQVGFNGIAMRHGARNNRIVDCLIEHTGLAGISITTAYDAILGAGFQTWEEGWISRDNQVENNLVQYGGELGGGEGQGIVMHATGGNRIVGNTIRHMTRGGVLLGDTSYGFFKRLGSLFGTPITLENHMDLNYSRNNLIQGNDISHVLTDSSDCGAFYSFGGGSGNRIEGNYIHDYAGLPEGIVTGIYLDDSADGFTVRGNLVARVGGAAPHAHPLVIKGRGNVIEQNVFLDNISSDLFLTMESNLDAYAGGNAPEQREPTDGIVFRRNVFLETFEAGRGPRVALMYNYKPDTFAVFDDNLFFIREMPETMYSFYGNGLGIPEWGSYRPFSYAEWHETIGTGFNTRSLLEDPRILADDLPSVRYAADSPAASLGIEPLDLSTAGITDRNPYYERFLLP